MVAPMRLKVGLYVNDPQANLLKFVRALRDWNMDFVSVWRDQLPACHRRPWIPACAGMTGSRKSDQPPVCHREN